MAAGDATAADCGPKYDVVINGKGYCFLDSLESSIPFRTHRAIYGQTQPFVERQNVSNSYGDNAQDFFLTIRQRDWSLGEQQKYFRAGNDGRYWMGSNVDVSVPGQVRLSPAVTSLTFAAAAQAACRYLSSQSVAVATATTLYDVDAQTGAITSHGAHGLGATPARYGICNDAESVYLTSTAGGSVGVRKWDGSSFTTFAAAVTGDSLTFVNNTVYLWGAGTLVSLSTAGVATTLFPWKSGAGTTGAGLAVPKLCPFGGKVLLAFPYAQESSELWIYDGSGASRLEVFPENFIVNDIDVLYGVVYVAGSFMKVAGASTVSLKPAILFYDGSQLGLLWQANDFNTTATSSGSQILGPHPALGVSNGRLVFTDETTGNFMAYNPASGGVSSIGAFTPNSGDSTIVASTGLIQVHIRNQTGGYLLPATTYPSSGYVISSLVDFDSSLKKLFRGVTVEFDAATDGNGGSIDVAYQLDGLAGSWTSLATGVTSGVEAAFPANTSGHAVAVKVTINKGTSTAGPTLKSLAVRGAPMMPVYARGEYIIDCTGTAAFPREIRDGTYHPLTGYEQVQNLLTARNSANPFTVVDRVNGSYTAYVDVNDAEGFDVYEVHPANDDTKREGSYIVRLTTRGV